MKRVFFILFYCLLAFALKAQPLPDSVKIVFNAAKSNVEKGRVLISYFDINTDKDTILSSLIGLKKYFEKIKEPVIVDYISMGICRQLSRGTAYTEAISELFQLLPRFEKRKDDYGVMVCNRHLSYAYYAAGDSAKALYYDRITLNHSVSLGKKNDMAVAYNNLAADMAEYGHFDSAFICAENAIRIAQEINDPLLIAKTFSTMAEGYIARKEYDSAIHYIRKSIPIARVYSQLDYVYALNDFAQIYLEQNQLDSAIQNTTLAIGIANNINLMNQLLRGYNYLSIAYNEVGPLDSAYKYLRLTMSTRDSMYSVEKTKQVQLIDVREQNLKRDAEQQQIDLENKVKIYALLGGLGIFTFIGFILYRNNRKEKNAKLLLQKKNELIEKTLGDLKATQSQLIQSEKMASLGELTAGIAHEIQNPLNFVNNFSEINKELVEELRGERLKAEGVKNTDIEEELLDDIEQNSIKINEHGKRADAIVKGMLQHSQSSSGKKESTDINKLADEYLRLAYHGIRAKDNSFNATLQTDFDESIGNINIIPQDIGRVLLNLITNAFYAVGERQKIEAEAFKPTVLIQTKKIKDKIEIQVADNGGGIPQHIIDKIFQPFFTTKPTGQGTGLGLSLAYDTVKAHGGELKVEIKEANSTVFIVTLPV